MNTLKTEKTLIPHTGATWRKNFGWYGVVFFFIKGALWLTIPFIMYAVN